jgi:hypothetical protein
MLAVESYSLNINNNKIIAFNAGNPGPGLGQVHKCGGVKPVNVIPTPFLIIESITVILYNKR